MNLLLKLLRQSLVLCFALFVALVCCFATEAKVTRIVIEQKQSPAYAGKSFGQVGYYETLTGKAYGELDPKNPQNAIITDIEFAPRNARGMVEYASTFTLLKPIDLAKANGVLLHALPNRGIHTLSRAFGIEDQPGEEFFLQRGYIILYSGWQGDLEPGPNTETISVPIAKNKNGSSITGAVLARFSNMPAGTTTMPLPPAHEAASLDTAKATLTKRDSEAGAIIQVDSVDWAFGDCNKTVFPGAPDRNKICLKGGFNPVYLYELLYTAKDPLVLGIGFAATRDISAFFQRAAIDSGGQANPIAGHVTHVIGQGVSQAGNFVRTFIHLGFNQDEQNSIVWEAANAHIAGRQVALNIRFAHPGGRASFYEPGSEAPVWWGDYEDKVRGRKMASLLDRCRSTKTCPKIFETFGSAEFWALRFSPSMLGANADMDIPLPPNVYRYYFPGTTHNGGRGGFSTEVAEVSGGIIREVGEASGNPGVCDLPGNPNPEAEQMRALIVALTDWVTKNSTPPASVYPRLDRGDLVRPFHTEMGFPLIPGAPLPDNMLNPFWDYDFGQEFKYGDLSGVISLQPPIIKRVLPSLVPKVDADGNETTGIGSPLHQAPLGAYLGWNVTRAGFYKGSRCGFAGSFIPFAKTKAERIAKGDPRLSLEERYKDHEGYVAAVKKAVESLLRRRFLLPEDAARLIQQAVASSVLRSEATR